MCATSLSIISEYRDTELEMHAMRQAEIISEVQHELLRVASEFYAVLN